MWTHYDKRPYGLNGTCCYNSCTTLNPYRLQSVSGLNTTPLCSWVLSLEDCAYCTGFSGVMLAWHNDNPNLYQYILWVSTHQNQQHLIKQNNKLKILLWMYPLDFWRRRVVCISHVLEMSTKQWDLYCSLTLNGSEQASKKCKNCSNKALCLGDTVVLSYLCTLQYKYSVRGDA